MRLRGLVVGAMIMVFAAPALAQVKVREHGPKDKDDGGGVKVREHGPPPKTGVTVKNFAPTEGAVGTKVTIAGDGFTKQTKVLVGGKPVKLIGWTQTTLLFAIPAKFGDGTLIVRHPGAGNDILAGTFAVIADPVIARIAPSSGPAGTRVEITGSGYRQGDQVMFNDRALAPNEFSATRIVVTIPNGATTDHFMIARPGGVRTRAVKPFTVTTPAPMISSFAPTSGPPGTAVRITGANFADDDKVFYAKTMLVPTARTSTTIDVMIPPNARTNEVITIRGSRGSVATAQPFVVIINPAITRFAPLWGAPGTRVTIDGESFRPGDSVVLNTRAVPVLSLDAGRMVVEIPQGAQSGSFQIYRGGQLVATAPKPFEVVLAPAITTFSPTGGPVGTQVTISGANFGPETRVIYGAQNLKVLSNNGSQLIVAIPNGASSQTFTVRTRGGEVSTTQAFQVYVYSTISSVTPLSGPVGTRIWIKGTNFNASDAFYIGQASLPIVERQPEGYIVTVPANAVTGMIEWDSYGRRQTSRFRFEVLQPPAISGFSPTSGPPGTQVALTGANFTNRTAVFYGNLPCQIVRRVLPSQLVAVIPQNAQGTDYLWVEDAGVRMKSQQTFQVVPPPVISSISPLMGPPGSQVTIQGANFTGGTSVWLGKVNGLRMEVVKRQGANLIIATIPVNASGADYVWVEERGQTARSLEMFRIVQLPQVSSVQPLSGPVGTNVTLMGANFGDNIQVWFGSLACPVIGRSGTTSITIAIPAGAKGKAAFILEDNQQRVVTGQMFEVTVPPPPPTEPANHPAHDHAHDHPHEVGDHHHHPHAHPHRAGSNHHHPY